jgi:abequosyltransferase
MTSEKGQSSAQQPALSICIPTYNFGRFIGETLRSILSQATPAVEVVVLDSGSTDDTAAVVQQFQREFSGLRYCREDKKNGIDRDMALVVEMARGDYCWLFSADDVMVPGALALALNEIKTEADVYLCMHSNHTFSMDLIDERHPVFRSKVAFGYELSDPRQQMKYFSDAMSTEAFFSFMGGLIVKRATWRSVPLNEIFVGSCWAHVSRLFELIPKGLRVRFVAAVFLQRRGDNDSFATHGVVRRYSLAIRGYQELARHFWGESSPQSFHVRRVLRNEFGLGMFLHAKALCASNPTIESRELLNELLISIHSDLRASCMLKRLVFNIFPVGLIEPSRRGYRILKKRRWVTGL